MLFRPPCFPDHTRIARFLAKGYPVQAVVAAEKVDPKEMKALLGDHGFRGLIGWFRRLHALPPEERLKRLVQHAMEVLEESLLAGNLQAGSFILAEHRAGRHPADTLARRVAACLDAVPPGPRPEARSPGPPRGPTLAPGSRPDTRQLCRDVEFRELVETSVGQNSLLHKLEQPAEAIGPAADETKRPTGPAPEPAATASDPSPASSPKPRRPRTSVAPEPKPDPDLLPSFVPGMTVGLGAAVYAANAP